MLEFEREYQEKGYSLIGGMDEVGRGPLAGPVCSALVIMPLDDLIEGVNDSKKLSKKKREELYPLIIEKAIAYSISFADEKVIDKINILQATKKTMIENIEKISVKPSVVLVDAFKLQSDILTVGIIKGDLKSYSIACASIVAKVERDKIMEEYSKKYPEYHFEKNAGYGTKVHIDAIKTHGACAIHRMSFLKNIL